MRLSQIFKFFASLTISMVWSSAHALCLICTCTATAPTLAFGSFNPLLGTTVSGSTTLTVRCTALAAIAATITVALSKGGATSFNPRRMLSGANTLNYNLFVPVSLGGGGTGYTTIWGDGTAGTATPSQTVSIAILGTNIPFLINGQIAAPQTTAIPSTGYTDTITATVTY